MSLFFTNFSQSPYPVEISPPQKRIIHLVLPTGMDIDYSLPASVSAAATAFVFQDTRIAIGAGLIHSCSGGECCKGGLNNHQQWEWRRKQQQQQQRQHHYAIGVAGGMVKVTVRTSANLSNEPQPQPAMWGPMHNCNNKTHQMKKFQLIGNSGFIHSRNEVRAVEEKTKRKHHYMNIKHNENNTIPIYMLHHNKKLTHRMPRSIPISVHHQAQDSTRHAEPLPNNFHTSMTLFLVSSHRRPRTNLFHNIPRKLTYVAAWSGSHNGHSNKHTRCRHARTHSTPSPLVLYSSSSLNTSPNNDPNTERPLASRILAYGVELVMSTICEELLDLKVDVDAASNFDLLSGRIRAVRISFAHIFFQGIRISGGAECRTDLLWIDWAPSITNPLALFNSTNPPIPHLIRPFVVTSSATLTEKDINSSAPIQSAFSQLFGDLIRTALIDSIGRICVWRDFSKVKIDLDYIELLEDEEVGLIGAIYLWNGYKVKISVQSALLLENEGTLVALKTPKIRFRSFKIPFFLVSRYGVDIGPDIKLQTITVQKSKVCAQVKVTIRPLPKQPNASRNSGAQNSPQNPSSTTPGNLQLPNTKMRGTNRKQYRKDKT